MKKKNKKKQYGAVKNQVMIFNLTTILIEMIIRDNFKWNLAVVYYSRDEFEFEGGGGWFGGYKHILNRSVNCCHGFFNLCGAEIWVF